MQAEEEMQAWRDWQQACALSRISELQAERLREVISGRFCSRLRKLQTLGMPGLNAPTDRECAHLFETYCALHQRRDGKKYKHWLLSRGRRDLDTIQSGVMLLIRNVVREWIRDCHPRTAALSLHQPLQGGLSPVPLEQLLPDSAAVPRSAEQQNWLTKTLIRERGLLDDCKSAVLILRAQGIVFSAPGVKETYGYGKSALHKCHRDWLTSLAEELQEEFPDLSAGEGCGMVLDLLDDLGKEINSEKLVENPARLAFGEVKEHHDDLR